MSEYHVIPSLHYNFLDDLKAVFFSLSHHELHPHVKVKILWSLPQSPPVMVHCAFKKCLILVLQPGMEPVSLQWKHRVLTTGPPGNSQHPLLCVWYDGWSLLYVYLCQELLFFFFFKWQDNYFTILLWFLPYLSFNWPKVYICPLPLENPSHLPPYPTPLGCHRAPALSSLHRSGFFFFFRFFFF